MMQLSQFNERVNAVLGEESQNGESYHWLSFVNNNGFQGVAIVKACGFLSAVKRTHELGINPGGEVAGTEFPKCINDQFDVLLAGCTNRLLSRKEATALDTRLADAKL